MGTDRGTSGRGLCATGAVPGRAGRGRGRRRRVRRAGLRSVSFTPPALASLLPLSRDCNRDLGRRATAPSRCRWLAPKPAENAHNPRLTDPHKASRDSRPQAVPASADSWLVGQERSGGRHLSSSEEADRLYVLERLCVFKRNASLSSLHARVLLSSSDPQTTCSLLWESEGNRMLPAPYLFAGCSFCPDEEVANGKQKRSGWCGGAGPGLGPPYLPPNPVLTRCGP